jgi:hypothetical protein
VPRTSCSLPCAPPDWGHDYAAYFLGVSPAPGPTFLSTRHNAGLGIISSGLLESSENPVAVSGQIVDERALRQTAIELSRVPGAVALYGNLVGIAARRRRD